MDYLSLPVTARFAIILEYLCRAVGEHTARDRSAGVFVTLVWHRLRRLAKRFAALVARAEAGTLPPPRPAGVFAPPRKPRERKPPDPAQALPRKFAWLVRRIRGTAAAGSQLQHLLADPAMVAFLAATPGAARMLRPLCHMLGVRPVPPLPPPAPRRSPVRTGPPRPRKPRKLSAPREERFHPGWRGPVTVRMFKALGRRDFDPTRKPP